MKKACTVLIAVCLTIGALLPTGAWAADVPLLPDVTQEMCSPDYWAAGMEAPDALLAGAEEIARLNAAALAASGGNMHDLRSLPEVFDGLARCKSLPAGAAADAAYYLGWTWDETGKKLTQADFDKIVANCVDPDATEEMPLRYGVAVNRSTLVTFPYEGQILDDPVDYDFDYQALVGIRVNEPVAVYTTSADGKFYQVCNSCCAGWMRVEDVALCADREEWLSAWDVPAEKRLVFWGDKMYTDYSMTAPETSGRLITMGTVLERMDAQEADALVINRLPLHNYAVYLPVRNDDGSYAKVPALINASERLSEDYLPLTGRNLAAVALASLGDAYGWGASLNNEDCSSLNRSVYLCFGLDLPRNGNWQWTLDLAKADAAYMTTEEKLAVLDQMPLGTLLNFPGHQMMYLGRANGKYYVVSAVSSIMSPATGKRQRTRDVQLNTLELRRANGKTWIEAVNTLYIPWVSPAEDGESPMPALPWYHDATAFCLENRLMDCADGGWFCPDDAATRAAAADVLWRMAGKPEPEGTAEGFWDVEPGTGNEAALWAQEQGIIRGVDGSLLPDAPLTREQLAVMLCRYTGAEREDASDALSPFGDAGDVSEWARGAMAWAVGTQLIRGRDAETLAPKDTVTRAELAVIAQRLCASAQAAPEDGPAQ